MKAIPYFHGGQVTKLYHGNILHFSLLRKSSSENLPEPKLALYSLQISDACTPATTEYLFQKKSQDKIFTAVCTSRFSNVKTAMHDARQSLIQFKNDLHISSRIKNFQLNYGHKRNHEIHEEVKVILYGMIGCCLYYSVLGRNEATFNRVAAGLAAMFFSGVLIQQNLGKKQSQYF